MRLREQQIESVSKMVSVRQFSPRFNFVFWMFWTALASLMTLLSLVFFLGSLFGGDALATVVHVYSQEAYTIRFTTRDGRTCETPHKWMPRADPVSVNDTFKVHYSKISPCDNVDRGDDWFARYGAFLIPPAFLAIGSVNLRRLRQRS
jgi:hypothetical protein